MAKNKLSIFISYARGDRELAKDIAAQLKRISPTQIDTLLDLEFLEIGGDWRRKIDMSLDAADILLIVYTDQAKPSHSYTGYEVGYFIGSKARRQNISTGVERFVIPFTIGCQLPATAGYLQGVIVDQGDIISMLDDVNQKLVQPNRLNEENPVSKLLHRVADVAAKVTKLEADPRAIDDNIRDAANLLYDKIFSYLKTRKWFEDLPERKIVIRTDPITPGTVPDLRTAEVELEGRSFDLFGIYETQTRTFSWEKFLAKISPPALGQIWSEGIKLIVSAALKRDHEDNYYVVSNLSGDKAFRLFVSRIVTFYGGKVEIHIYVIEMKSRDYGDPTTTRLLKAISVGARFRFLILDSNSPFTVENLRFPAVKMRSQVTSLLSQMHLILRDTNDANLEDPILLRRIFGDSGHTIVERNVRTWNEALSSLEAAAHQLLNSADPVPDAQKQQFLLVLGEFARKTEAINREFTICALDALTKEIKKSMAQTTMTTTAAKPESPGEEESRSVGSDDTIRTKHNVVLPLKEVG